jgi:hypothetical protein
MIFIMCHLIAAAFILANFVAAGDLVARRAEARKAAYDATLRAQSARYAMASHPAKIRALDDAAAAARASGLLITADYHASRANVLRARLATATARLA